MSFNAVAGYLGDLARGKREGDGEPAKSDWEDLQAAVLAGDTKALQVADAVMAQAKSRTDAERMEALGRLLQEESVEDWRSLQLGAPRAAMPASDSVSSRDPRNLRDPSNGTTACDFRGADFGCLFCRQASLVSRLDFDAAAGCGSASLTDGRCEALQGLARPTFRPRVKRRRSTRALVLPKKPVNLVFALETWLEGTHQH
ncbi:unnamed protein product [Effrenium voratum]|nr:unnamed protein product [Effrenium voratum]